MVLVVPVAAEAEVVIMAVMVEMVELLMAAEAVAPDQVGRAAKLAPALDRDDTFMSAH